MSEVEFELGTVKYYRAAVRPKKAGRVFDPTGDDVFFAFLKRGTEWSEDLWAAGEWEYVDDEGWAHCMALVGEAPFDLGAGLYHVYARIVDNPEKPKEYLGVLRMRAPRTT